MKSVLMLMNSMGRSFEENPLLKWLRESESDVERKLWLGIFSAPFVMHFSDLNRYHISYGDEAAGDRHRTVLNQHAAEDMTHSELFVKDFSTLGWEQHFGSSPRLMDFLYTHPDLAQLRAAIAELTSLVIHSQDPAARFAVVEAIEASGNGLFRHTAPLALEYRKRTGKELVFWGDHHLTLENGHTMTSDEEAFAGLRLDKQRRAQVTTAATETFRILDDLGYEMMRLVQDAVERTGLPDISTAHDTSPKDSKAATLTKAHPWCQSSTLHPSHGPTAQALAELVASAERSALTLHLREAAHSASFAALRRFMPALALDVCARRTLYDHTLPFRRPLDHAQRRVGTLARLIGPSTASLFTDWQNLDMDGHLQWSATDCLRYLFLEPGTEPVRALHATLTRHFTADDINVWLWAAAAASALSIAFNNALAGLGRAVQDAEGLSLPFLSAPDLSAWPVDGAYNLLEPAGGPSTERATAAVRSIAEALQQRDDVLFRYCLDAPALGH